MQKYLVSYLFICSIQAVAIVLNKIMYVLPVYFGHLTEGRRHMLQ